MVAILEGPHIWMIFPKWGVTIWGPYIFLGGERRGEGWFFLRLTFLGEATICAR